MRLRFLALPAGAQVETVTAKLEPHSVAARVMHVEGALAFKHGIALFPGCPGILKLREEQGAAVRAARHFLVRSRRHWLDDETFFRTSAQRCATGMMSAA